MLNKWRNSGNSGRFYFFGLQNHYRWWLQPRNWKILTNWEKSYDQPRQHINKQRHYFANKGPSTQGYGFSSGHVLMWELDYKESWALKNWCFWTMVLEKTLESPLDCKETNQSILKEISPGISLEGMMLKLKLQYFVHLMQRVGKDFDAGRDWGQEEKGMTGWDGWMASRLDGHESEWTPGVGYRQGGLACCDSWDHRESYTTERLNWTELNWRQENENFRYINL